MKNYIKDFIQFQKINEAVASEDLLTKDMVAQEMVGEVSSAERAAAYKKFEVKDSKGKSLGPPDIIVLNPENNNIFLRYQKNPQLFEYAEKISLSYNGKPLRLTSKLVEEPNKVSRDPDETLCVAKFAYQPKGLPSPMKITVIFSYSKMETAMQSWR
jgi:hypothetical protein